MSKAFRTPDTTFPRALRPSRRFKDDRPVKAFADMRGLYLPELPSALLPDPAKNPRRRLPPRLCLGYAFEDEVALKIAVKAGYGDTIPSGPLDAHPTFVALDYLADLIGYPHLEYRDVYGTPLGQIFEVANNYGIGKGASPEAIEILRQELGEEGPPLWYLDIYHADWDQDYEKLRVKRR